MICRAALIAVAVLMVAPTAFAADPAPATWQRAIGPWAWSFPRDHGAHRNFKSEWWYFTGNLKEDGTGRPFGYQLTIFRQGVQLTPAQKNSQWAVRDFYFGHFTISDIAKNEFHVAEKVSRGALGEAHAETGGMDVAIGPWSVGSKVDLAQEHYLLQAKDGDMAIAFDAQPSKPLVLEGTNGLSQKSSGAGNASYYYSFPRLATTGTLILNGKAFPIHGSSWFDHEFSTSSLGPDQVGWDWYCLQFDNGEELMLYCMRNKAGTFDKTSRGVWIDSRGGRQEIGEGEYSVEYLDYWKSPASPGRYPSKWRIRIPKLQAELVILPRMADQELRLHDLGEMDYWEGACTVKGYKEGHPISGVGYTELTGYATPLGKGMKD